MSLMAFFILYMVHTRLCFSCLKPKEQESIFYCCLPEDFCRQCVLSFTLIQFMFNKKLVSLS